MSSRSSFLGFTGGAAGVAALLFAVLSRGPARAPQPAPTPPSAAAKQTDVNAVARGEDLLRAALAGDFEAAACGRDRKARYDLDVLVAVVPDPVRSRMDWMYDAELEAIRRAHAAAGYVLAQFWLPWDPATARLDASGRASVPGLLLFRRSANEVEGMKRPSLRLVYVVGEMPTGGVDLHVLRAALRERDRLRAMTEWSRTPQDTLRVLGPSFSGSTESLARGLRDWLAAPDTVPAGAAPAFCPADTASPASLAAARDEEPVVVKPDVEKPAPGTAEAGKPGLADGGKPAAPKPPAEKPLAAEPARGRAAHVVSGAATLAQNARVLAAAHPALRFEATVHSTDDYQAVLDSVVLAPLGIPRNAVALLQESGTEYGAQGIITDTTDAGVLRVAVPMNISGIRRDTKLDGESPSAATLLRGLQAARVGLPLRSGADGQEQPDPLSDLTPALTSATLDELVRTLREHRVQAVGMRFTDVRDNIYLAGEVRRRLRDVQLFTFESNALYVHPDHNAVLNGMVVISTYPLFHEAQTWAASGAGARQSFPADAAEGTYNAMLRLLGRDSLMLDYAPPFGVTAGPSRPPVWVTVVGAKSMVPLRYVPRPAAYALTASAAPGDSVRCGYRGCGHPHRAEGTAALGSMLLGLAVVGLGLHSVVDALRRRRHEVDAAASGRWVRLARRAAARLPAMAGVAAGGGGGGGVGGVGGRGGGLAGAAGGGGGGMSLRLFLDRRGAPAPPPGQRRAEQAVHTGALHLQREILLGLRVCAAAGMLAPLLALLWRASVQPRVLAAVAVLAGGAWIAAVVAGVVLGTRVVRRHHDEGQAYALRRGWWRTFEGSAWMVELVARLLVIVLGVLYVGSLCWLVREVVTMDTPRFELLFHRALQGASGVSPLVPLLLTGAGMMAWCTWHLARLKHLARVTAFEGAFLHGAAGCVPALPLADRVQCVRATLFLLLPRGQAAAVASLVLLLVAGVWLRFVPSLESAVLLRPSVGVEAFYAGIGVTAAICALGAWALAAGAERRKYPVRLLVALSVLGVTAFAVAAAPWRMVSALIPYSAFDALLRFGVLCSLAITVWGVYRLLALWISTAKTLRVLAGSPLLCALSRLPARVAQSARLTLGGAAESDALEALADATWTRVRDPGAPERAALAAALGADGMRELKATFQRRAWHPCSRFGDSRPAAVDLRRLLRALGTLWEAEAPAGRAARMRIPDPAAASVDDAYAGHPEALRTWLRDAEDLLALLVAEYVRWVLSALHKLAIFLFCTLLLTTMLLSSYPFQPQSTAKMIFLGVLMATVGSILYVMTQANRDEVLSRISGTPPGQITWDSSFILNGLLVSVVPMLVLISAEFPEVRDALFSWLGPLMKAITGG